MNGGYEHEAPRLGTSRKFSILRPRLSDQPKADFAALFDENVLQKMVMGAGNFRVSLLRMSTAPVEIKGKVPSGEPP